MARVPKPGSVTKQKALDCWARAAEGAKLLQAEEARIAAVRAAKNAKVAQKKGRNK